MKGKVYLVGAGPGDPELLTVKALRLLRTADTVLHDDLVAPQILELVSGCAQVYNVGKRRGEKKILQAEINSLMVELALSGLRVVRLKSGDPLIFGRAGEEIEALRCHDIPFEIVPGVTSALGAAAAAEIPLTHRRASSAVVFMTAHQAFGSRASAADAHWNKLAGSGATLVIYMPGPGYAEVANRLLAAGLSSGTPCALISRASTSNERTHRTTVLELTRAPQFAAPALLVVGEVVRLAATTVATLELGITALAQERENLLQEKIVF
jgi:uroporphyrin-III C-methyltransferase